MSIAGGNREDTVSFVTGSLKSFQSSNSSIIKSQFKASSCCWMFIKIGESAAAMQCCLVSFNGYLRAALEILIATSWCLVIASSWSGWYRLKHLDQSRSLCTFAATFVFSHFVSQLVVLQFMDAILARKNNTPAIISIEGTTIDFLGRVLKELQCTRAYSPSCVACYTVYAGNILVN